MRRWPWVVYLALVVGGFWALEQYALVTDNVVTLSYFVWETSQAWPPLPWVIGNITGGLAVHFWWQWRPTPQKNN